MRFPDPYALRREEPKETVAFAASQRQGEADTQEDYFLNFNDECFVVTDGVSLLPHGEVAAKLAAETAIWAYKHIRQHRYYFLDKRFFMKRLFRTTNMAVWQKHREEGFTDGMATTLLVLMVGAKNAWVGNAGDSCAWILKNGVVKKIAGDKKDFASVPPRALGLKRLGLVPAFAVMPFDKGDVLLLATDGASDYLTPSDIQAGMMAAGTTVADITAAVTSVLSAAQTNGAKENMTVCMVTRLPR